MDNYTQIYLKGYGYLDVVQDVPLPVNYSLAEVKDVFKRNSSFTKTIILPGTKNNNELLGMIFEVNLSFNDCTFKINKKVEATIFQNDQPVLSGWFKLININKVSPSDISFDENIQYECVVFSNQAGIYDKIKDLDISEIDLSAYNHNLSLSAITASTSYNYNNVYKYIWHYTAEDKYRVSDFRPAVYAKPIWDKIFQNAGFTYTGNFPNQAPFTKLLLPTNTRDLLISDEEVLKRSMRVSFISGLTQSGVNIFQRQSTIIPNFSIGPTWLYNEPVNITVAGTNLTSVTRLRFNDETTGVNFDGAYNNYSTTTQEFTAKKTAQYEMELNLGGNINVFTTEQLFYPLFIFNSPPFLDRDDRLINDMGVPAVQVNANFQVLRASGGTWTTFNSFSKKYVVPMSTINPNFTTGALVTWGIGTSQPGFNVGTTASVYSFICPKFLVDLNVGDRVRIVFNALAYRTVLLKPIQDNTPPRAYNNSRTVQYIFTINGYNTSNSFWKVKSVKNNLTTGDEIILNDLIPQKLKQIEFIKSIVNMFNLYLIADDNDPKNIIIKTRDEYYNDYISQYVNWTDKIDYSQNYTLQLLSELQNKTLNFTYKEPKDDVNIRYKEQVGLLYGQYRLNFDNDFLNGEQKFEVMFEPTPLVKTLVPLGDEGNTFIVPYLQYQSNSNPKILYDGGSISVSGYTIVDGTTNYTLNYYNYAGHFDNPINPTFDINWNINEFYFYNEVLNNITDNNLFNEYWYKYVELISQSKLLTAYFNLDEYDIASLNFAKLVWIRDSYWYINRIIDYDANNPKLTKVELIKAIDHPKFTPRIRTRPTILVDTQVQKPWLATGGSVILDNYQAGYTRNTNFGSNSQVVGFENNILTQAKNTRTLGDNNIIGTGAQNITIDGNDNFVGGGTINVKVQGNQNRIEGTNVNISLINCNQVRLLGNVGNLSATNLENEIIDTIFNRTYISPYVYMQDGVYVNNSNIVDGILDGQINYFKPNPIPPTDYVENLIDAGEDIIYVDYVQGADLLNGIEDGIRFDKQLFIDL